MKKYKCSVLKKVSKEYTRKIAMRLEALKGNKNKKNYNKK